MISRCEQHELGGPAAQRVGAAGLGAWLSARLGPEQLRAVQLAGAELAALPRDVVVVSTVLNLAGLVMPLVVLQVYDRILPNQAVDTLALLLVGLCGVVILEAFLKIARAQMMGWAAMRTAWTIEQAAVQRLLSAPLSDVERANPTTWVQRFDALADLQNFQGGPTKLVLLDVPFVGIFLIIAALVGGWLVLVPLAFLAMAVGYSAIHGGRLKKTLVDRAAHDNRRYDFIHETLRGIHTVKGLAMEPLMMRRFERLQAQAAGLSYRVIIGSNDLQTVSNLISNLASAAVVGVGALMVIDGALSVGALACCSMLAGRIIQPVVRGISAWGELQSASLAGQRAAPLLTLAPMAKAPGQPKAPKLAPIYLIGATLEDGGRRVLDRITETFQPGEIIGISGGHGAGKTVLARAIMGELALSVGEVRYGATPVTGLGGHNQLQAAFSYVPHHAPIVRGTILENITMHQAGPVRERARDACRLIGLEAEIHRMPDGYDTMMGDGVAENASAAMLQRIVIARAIAQDAPVILFDEAHAALDQQSEAAFRAALEALRGQRTVVLFGNRPSLLAVADRRFRLDHGRLIAEAALRPVAATGGAA